MIKGMQSRKELNVEFNRVLDIVYADRKLKNYIVEKMVERGFASGHVLKILSKRIPVGSLDNLELGLICFFAEQGLYELRKDLEKDADMNAIFTSLKVDLYYTEKEIKEMRDFRLKSEVKNDSTVNIFDNVYAQNKDQWIVPVVSMQQLFEIYKRGTFDYNLNAQRGAKREIVNGKIVEMATIIPEKVEEIKESIKAGLPVTNTLTFNIRRNGFERFDYNEKTKELAVVCEGDSYFDLTDGAHRFSAIVALMSESPQNYMNFSLNIFNIRESEAQDYIRIQDKQTPQDKLHIQMISNDDPYMSIAKDLNKEGSSKNNIMFGKIGKDLLDVDRAESYTTFNIIANALRHNIKKIEPQDTVLLPSYLKDGMSLIYSLYKNDFKDPEWSKTNSIVVEPNAFIGYIAILSKLYNQDDWTKKLLKTIQKIDLSKEVNERKWKEIGIYNTNITNSIIKSISEHFLNYLEV